MDEEIEVLDEETTDSNIISIDQIINTTQKQEEIQAQPEEVKTNEVIGMDRLFEDEEEVVDAYEEDQKKEEIKQNKITRIQIGLIIFLVVFASLIYFFGYNIVEPFIKID